MAKYRPTFVSQFSAHTQWDDENCVAAAGAMALDRQTLGAEKVGPAAIRNYATRANNNQPIHDGLSQTDVEKAWKLGWDEVYLNPTDPAFEPFSKFVDRVSEGRGAIIFGDCQRVRGHIRCPGGLSRNHALYINEIDSDGNRMLRYDPAERNKEDGVDWISLDVLRNYADNWTDKVGFVNAGYTKITPDASEGDRGGLPDGCSRVFQTSAAVMVAVGLAILERG